MKKALYPKEEKKLFSYLGIGGVSIIKRNKDVENVHGQSLKNYFHIPHISICAGVE
jgi:hypothetical protein